MNPPLLLLALILIHPLSAASSPPRHHSGFSKNRLHSRTSTAPPQEYIEVTRPLPFDCLTSSCMLPILSHSFGKSINAAYSPPRNCAWSNAVLQFSAASSGSQHCRIASVWLSGAELLRSNTPQPTPEGIFWNFRKDVTRYASLLRQSNLTLSVVLENVVNDDYTGTYHVNLTFLYYDVASTNPAANIPLSLFPPNQKSIISKSRESQILHKSHELNENPADLVLPISAGGEGGFWFKIERESDEVYQGIQIPLNTYRAVIEVYVSFHGNDEFWYSNPPNYYIEMNGLPAQRRNGAYREVLVRLDDNVVGSVIPFPVIFTGGINPFFWEPIVSIGAFDLPSYEVELTPFLGLLLDGKVHYFGLAVADAISFWLVDANLHLWLDGKADKVQAGPLKYSDGGTCVERELKFDQLDGLFTLEGQRKREFSGWVKSSAGNFTTHFSSKVKFENTIKFKHNGMKKSVKQEVKVINKLRIKSPLGHTISNMSLERRYPLKLKTTTVPESKKDTYSTSTELDHSLEEKKKNGKFESKLETNQESSGWITVADDGALSYGATTYQRYYVKDSYGSYTRKVLAEDGAITSDKEDFPCARAAS